MDNLLQYITFTKGIGYLIAIAFLIAFVVFWQIMYGRGKSRGRVVTITVLSCLVLGIAVLVGSCLAGAPH
jgi:riboflavin transporter FmnP